MWLRKPFVDVNAWCLWFYHFIPFTISEFHFPTSNFITNSWLQVVRSWFCNLTGFFSTFLVECAPISIRSYGKIEIMTLSFHYRQRIYGISFLYLHNNRASHRTIRNNSLSKIRKVCFIIVCAFFSLFTDYNTLRCVLVNEFAFAWKLAWKSKNRMQFQNTSLQYNQPLFIRISINKLSDWMLVCGWWFVYCTPVSLDFFVSFLCSTPVPCNNGYDTINKFQ